MAKAGERLSEDTKRKIGDANRGRKHTAEAKSKMSSSQRRYQAKIRKLLNEVAAASS